MNRIMGKYIIQFGYSREIEASTALEALILARKEMDKMQEESESEGFENIQISLREEVKKNPDI